MRISVLNEWRISYFRGGAPRRWEKHRTARNAHVLRGRQARLTQDFSSAVVGGPSTHPTGIGWNVSALTFKGGLIAHLQIVFASCYTECSFLHHIALGSQAYRN